MIRRLLLIPLMAASTLFAQNGGSTYSRYGIGDLRPTGSSRSLAMGGTSIAVPSGYAVDALNPALWARISRTQFAAGLLYEGYSASDDRKSNYLSSASFNGVAFALPLVPQSGIALGAAVTPLSRINYNITTPPYQDGSTLQYLGEGGVSQAQIGTSVAPTGDLAFGAKLVYDFGTSRHTLRQDFPAGGSTNSEVIRSARFSGLGGVFGLTYGGLKKVFGLPESNALTVGLVASTATSLKTAVDRYYTYVTSALTTRDTLSLPEGTFHVPASFGAGLSYATDRMILAADYSRQDWSAATIDGTPLDGIRNERRIAVGGEVLPRREASAPFFQRTSYEFGIFSEATYYEIKGQPIDETGVSAGMGLPLFTDTRLFFSASYSVRGTTDDHLQRDRIFRWSLTFVTGELWFVRPPEE